MNHEHDYVRPEGATPFAYYRLPKVLFTDPDLRDMSNGAKLLYAMLLDRTGMSIRNGWIDGEQRVYIIYPMEEVKEMLNVSDKTASKFLRELIAQGLVERKLRGLGRPALLYVRNIGTEDDIIYDPEAQFMVTAGEENVQTNNTKYINTDCNETEFIKGCV